jgi:hypothetical protein
VINDVRCMGIVVHCQLVKRAVVAPIKTVKVLLLCFAVIINGCSRLNDAWDRGNKVSPTISGKYCTIPTEGSWVDGNLRISLVCLQSDGQWKEMGGVPEPQSTKGYFNVSLTRAEDGSILLGYGRYGTPDTELVLFRFRQSLGWSQVGSIPVNTNMGTIIPAYSQYGGQVFDFRGSPLLWSASTYSVEV